MTLLESFQIAKVRITDINALIYLRALDLSLLRFGAEGFQTQIDYVLCNCSRWRGEEAREVKKLWKETNFLMLEPKELAEIANIFK
jgi:hypothetical protein